MHDQESSGQDSTESLIETLHASRKSRSLIANPDYPGWEAALDGQPTPILRAYGALAAVAVPEGEHKVTFVYNPASYRVGAILSFITWGGLAIFVVVTGFRSRRRNARST